MVPLSGSFFWSSWGLRLGDLLLSYIFMLALEALSHLLVRAREGGYLLGFMVRGKGSEEVEVSHLLFIRWSFVRILNVRWFIYVGYSCGLK